MITRTALNTFIENLIETSVLEQPLFEAAPGKTLRLPVTTHSKVVRVDVGTYTPNISADECRKEMNVAFTIQCIVLPESTDASAQENALNLADDMARQVFEAIHGNDLGNGSLVSVDEIESADLFSIAATLYAGSYIDGVVNPDRG